MIIASKHDNIENKLPIYKVENNYIISKDADITAAFKVTLPEIFSISSQEYQQIHNALTKAIKLLPSYSIVHKQDWYITEKYQPKEEESFLATSFEKHFIERPFINHHSYLFITKTTKDKVLAGNRIGTLSRSRIVPREMQDKDTLLKFQESVEQFSKILNDTALLHLEKLTEDEICGNVSTDGIIQKYLSLTHSDKCTLYDLTLSDANNKVKVGDKELCIHTISDVEHLPDRLSVEKRFDKYSTEKTSCMLSYAAPVGLSLSCDHIYNQYIFIDDADDMIQGLESTGRRMQALSQHSRANEVNKAFNDEFLNTLHTAAHTPVRAHFNVIAWGEHSEEIRVVKNEVGSAISKLSCMPYYNTLNAAPIFWAGIPGNASDISKHDTFFSFSEHALCFFTLETNYKDSAADFGFKMVDRLSGKPILIDLHEAPLKKGIIANWNKFILGGSGTGKSFCTNHMVSQYYQQGGHVLMVDVGDSYQGLCNLINNNTKGEDGIYFTYTNESPISFNPFYTEDGTYDIEKIEYLKALILTMWKREDEKLTRSEEVALSNAVRSYTKCVTEKIYEPCFDTFFEYIKNEYAIHIEQKRIREKDFDIINFLNVLEPFYKDGEYGYLLNNKNKIDLLNKRFIVFELDNIKDNKVIFPIVTFIIMDTFVNKMRQLKGVKKMIVIEEAWKAIAKESMAEYIKYLFKTVRKHNGEAVVVTQEIDDILDSPIVKESIINNSDCKILLDQKKYLNKFDQIQKLLGLSDKEKAQVLSINLSNDPHRNYKEVFISLNGHYSAVYAVEVSRSEYFAYTTRADEKLKIQNLAKVTGDYENAIKEMVMSEKR